MKLNNSQTIIHSSEDFHSLGGSCRLVMSQLAKIAIHKAHEDKTAKGDDFPRIFTGECQVVAKWFAHDYGITLNKKLLQDATKGRHRFSPEKRCRESQIT
ncbi:MAG: hypothetical protein IKJ29_09390 [Akkermansia sp.]|nr:hypothetical protein [Akkermansia sp.]